MVSFYAGTFVVVHLHSTFSVDPQNFSTGANLYQKLWFFAIFAAVCPHFKARTVKFGMTMRTWDSLHQAKFCKNRLRGYTPFGQIYTKKCQFWRFGGCRPTFLNSRWWNLAWVCETGNLSHKPNLVKIAEGGIPLLGKFIPKITNFSDFGILRVTTVKFSVRLRTWDSLPCA